MVCDPARTGADVSNRGIGRARMFVGGLLLFAAVIAWATALWMSPHGERTVGGVEHVRTVVVVFLRNSALGTLVLCAVSAMAAVSGTAAALAGARLGDHRADRRDRRDQPLSAILAALRRSVSREHVAADVADAAVRSRISPRPAEALVHHRKLVSWREITNYFGLARRCAA